MDESTWDLVADERLALADLLEGLTPEQWEARSLCTQWRVRDVAAHLAMTPAGEPGVGAMVAAMVRARGHLWTAGRDLGIAYATRSYDDIVAGLRSTAASRTKPVFVVPSNILLDLVVHGQDIAVPLGLARPVPPAAGVVTLARCWSMGWPFWARRRLAGVALRTVDCDWRAGEGLEVRGTTADLLLVMTGRTATALPGLRGPGLERLTARLGATTTRASAGGDLDSARTGVFALDEQRRSAEQGCPGPG